VQTVTTVSTFPPPGTFTRPAHQIADIMASPEVSPKGLGSGLRMIQYFINRAGKNLNPNRRRELERAKRMLQRRLSASHTTAARSR
jgi:tRNA(adenine34) deaminase